MISQPSFSSAFWNNKRTFLGVGPMSTNCIDASIELSNQYKTPIMLIASRRQIDCAELGGGYVNNWCTEDFANYVRSKNDSNYIYLARDHGGPWQNNDEIINCPTIDSAMKSAKNSFLHDIQSGFSLIHIDPVITQDLKEAPIDKVLEKIYELYEFVTEESLRLNQNIEIEIGTEEQKANPLENLRELEYSLEKITAYCDQKKYKKPFYIVVQTGSKVMEMENIGLFPRNESALNEYLEKYQFSKIKRLCDKFGVRIKAHNVDYLPDQSIHFHNRIGINAINVAPEFGVAETTALLGALQKQGLHDLRNAFLDLFYSSNKWDKWVIPERNTTLEEKAAICGHYSFSKPRYLELKSEASDILKTSGINLEFHLKLAVKNAIEKYLFNLQKSNNN